MDQERIVELQLSQGKILVWNSRDVRLLRETHHIVGSLAGALPRAPRQNIQLGLPLELMPEEAYALVSYGVGKIVRLYLPNHSQEDVLNFQKERRMSFQKQKAIYLEEAKVKERQFRDLDLRLVSRKKRKRAAREKRLQKMSTDGACPVLQDTGARADSKHIHAQDQKDGQLNDTEKCHPPSSSTKLHDTDSSAWHGEFQTGGDTKKNSLNLLSGTMITDRSSPPSQMDIDTRVDFKHCCAEDSKGVHLNNLGETSSPTCSRINISAAGHEEIQREKVEAKSLNSLGGESFKPLDTSQCYLTDEQSQRKLVTKEAAQNNVKKSNSMPVAIEGEIGPGRVKVSHEGNTFNKSTIVRESNKGPCREDNGMETSDSTEVKRNFEKRTNSQENGKVIVTDLIDGIGREKVPNFGDKEPTIAREDRCSCHLSISNQTMTLKSSGSTSTEVIAAKSPGDSGQMSHSSPSGTRLCSTQSTVDGNVIWHNKDRETSLGESKYIMPPANSDVGTSANAHILNEARSVSEKTHARVGNGTSATLTTFCDSEMNPAVERVGLDRSAENKEDNNVLTGNIECKISEEPAVHSKEAGSDVSNHEKKVLHLQGEQPGIDKSSSSTSRGRGSSICTNLPRSSGKQGMQSGQHSTTTESPRKRSRPPDHPSEKMDDSDKATDDGCRVQLFSEALDPVLSEVTDWNFPSTDKEKLRAVVFLHFWEQGYYLTSGMKFGGDFLVYKGDPLMFHSTFIAVCVPYDKAMSSQTVISYGRLGPIVKKTVVLCYLNAEENVKCISLQWSGF